MMNKQGIELSFSMIFSVFIIAAILATAVYVMIHFVRVGNCSQAGIFVNDLQRKIDTMWNADEARETFKANLPSGVKEICFGTLEGARARVEYNALARFRDESGNLFFYPPMGSCSPGYGMLTKVTIRGFFCVPVVGGSATVLLEKKASDSLVSLCTQNTTRCSPGN